MMQPVHGAGDGGPMILPMLLIGNGLPWRLIDALSVSVVPKERAGMASGISRSCASPTRPSRSPQLALLRSE